MKGSKTTTKSEVKITTDIRAGPATPAMRTACRRFWSKLVAEVRANER